MCVQASVWGACSEAPHTLSLPPRCMQADVTAFVRLGCLPTSDARLAAMADMEARLQELAARAQLCQARRVLWLHAVLLS